MFKIRAKRQSIPLTVVEKGRHLRAQIIKTGEEILVDEVTDQMKQLERIGLLDIRRPSGKERGLNRIHNSEAK